MNASYRGRACQILRWESGRWIPCRYGDSRGEGKVALPEEVRQHLAEAHLGKFWASDGRLYWIRSARKKQKSK
jgi:hypothetical protein